MGAMRFNRFLGIVAVTGAFAGLLGAAPAWAAELKIGVVDYGKLVEESPQAKAALDIGADQAVPPERRPLRRVPARA